MIGELGPVSSYDPKRIIAAFPFLVRRDEWLELNNGNIAREVNLGGQCDRVVDGFRIHMGRSEHLVRMRAVADAEPIDCFCDIFRVDTHHTDVLDPFTHPICDKRIQSRPEPAR